MATKTVAERPTYTFAAGLITEQSALNVVPGSALDMENFELEVAGGLRRRKAIATESGGSSVTFSLSTIPASAAYMHRVWHNAGGTPGRKLHVIQVGTYLKLLPEGDTLSNAGTQIGLIDLVAYKTSSATTEAVYSNQVSFVDARTHLIVTGPYINPFYISLSGNNYTAVPISLRIRDFVGVEDGISITATPDTEIATHLYNLRNRGWTTAEIAAFEADSSTYPAKNMVPWLGYIREVDAGTQEGYGTKSWSTAKLEAEAFRNVSAPQGSLLLDPFNTTVAYTGGSGGSGGTVTNNIDIASWTRSGQTIELVLSSAHNIATGDTFQIVGNSYTWYRIGLRGMRVATHGTLDGNHTATVTGANTLRFTTTNNFAYFAGWGDGEGSFGQYNATGVAVVVNETTGGGGVSSDSGYITDHRPTAVAWYAGRVFYAGAAYAKIADTIFFSQIVEDASQYGLCYQRNDPTADTFNVLLPTDGGTIKIPGLHGVLRMEILGDALIVFSRAGVWEIRGGRGGFSAMDYNVRKITDAECVSAGGVCRTDAGLVFASKRGLYVLGIDTNSGFISSGNVTEARLNTYWSQIPDDNLETIYMVYDDSKKRVYTLISKPNSVAANPSVRGLTEALVLDLKHGEAGAFYRLTLPYGGTGYVIGGLALDSADNPASNKKIKFVWKPTSSAYIRFLDMEHTSFTDEDGEDRPPYYKAAWDAAVPAEGVDGRTTSDWHTRKQAGLYVYMFLGRTETGWTEVNQELYPVNPGSVFIQGRWEWSDSSNSGKWTAPQQAYRPKGLYSPFGGAGEGMQNGAPVIVTRNKIRGSGRSLGLYITGEEGKDAHILGWLIQYGVT